MQVINICLLFINFNFKQLLKKIVTKRKNDDSITQNLIYAFEIAYSTDIIYSKGINFAIHTEIYYFYASKRASHEKIN